MPKTYLRTIGFIERTLLSKGLFKQTYVVRFCNNLILTIIFMLKYLLPISKKNSKGREYYFARLELGFMLIERLPIIRTSLVNSYLYKNSLELLTNPQKESEIEGSSNFTQRKILILGPGIINVKLTHDHDIQLLLNPNLKSIQFEQNMNYIIALNKVNTKRYLNYLDEISSKSNVLLIYVKKEFPGFEYNKKIKLIDPTCLMEMAPTSGTPNLLQIILFEIVRWNTEQIQVLGCDMFLGENEYRPGVKPTHIPGDVNNSFNLLNSLSFHNPFAQLSFVKIFEVFLINKGVRFISELNDIRYLEMASTYKKKRSAYRYT